MERMNFGRFRCVIISLTTVSSSKVSVTRSGGRILCLKIAFRFPVMIRGFLIMVRGVVMMARGRMLTGHAWTPILS
jgi:hypothetical protein